MSIKLTLSRVQKAPAPQMIGRDPSRDYFAAYFQIRGNSSDRFMFKSMAGGTVECLGWENDIFSRPEKLDVSVIDPRTIEVFHWYRKIQIRTIGSWAFIISQLSLRPIRHNMREYLAQKRYNYSFKLRQERQEVLLELFNRSINFSKEHSRIEPLCTSKSALEWFFDLHGERAAQHPDYVEHSLRFKALLRSLVASGDLEEHEHRFSVSAKSLISLSNFELEERRHQDQLSTNRRVVQLTFVLVLIAGIQAAIAFCAPQ